MPASNVTVRFNPIRLNQAIVRAFPSSVRVAIADAKAHSPTSKGGATGRVTSPTQAYIKPTGLGHIFESGRKGDYLILPRGVSGASRRGSRAGVRLSAKRGGAKALKFRDGGGFASAVTGGDMDARPYVGPAGQRWAQGGYQAVARRTLAAGGFR